MFSGTEIVAELTRLNFTHVIWVPDSVLGRWESALESSPHVQLVRVCREGEAWPLAAGLLVGGKSPLVVMQTTGLFESGDALRNIAFDLQLPVFAVIGARNWLSADSQDSAQRFAQPVLEAWGIEYVVLEAAADKAKFAQHYQRCRSARKPGIALLAE